MSPSPSSQPEFSPVAQPAAVENIHDVLAHFQRIERQLAEVRQGLTHSHRLTTLGTLTSIVAHEYNNILTPIISYAQLALAAPDDRELMRKAVEKALTGSERAAKISSSLLGFARDSGTSQPASLPRIIEDSIACLVRDPRRDGIDVVVKVEDLTPAIPAINLEQVLVNLLLNARKAMRHTGGRVEITSRRLDGGVILDVSDTGPGIPPAISDTLFEPFVTHSTDSGNPDEKGTGLGLCICRDLIEQAGGKISVTSTPGKGATFHIRLPLVSAN